MVPLGAGAHPQVLCRCGHRRRHGEALAAIFQALAACCVTSDSTGAGVELCRSGLPNDGT